MVCIQWVCACRCLPRAVDIGEEEVEIFMFNVSSMAGRGESGDAMLMLKIRQDAGWIRIQQK